ncbi:MAG TPA: hypothetical protein VED20_06065 [Streptosporangiaceae bacterium]|nr:hypothetical protein [Streptosporangiaceae bacterium]
MGTFFPFIVVFRDPVNGLADGVDGFGADGDADRYLVPGPVVADLELGGFIETALKRFGDVGEAQRELGQRLEQSRVPAEGGFGRVFGQPGEFGGLGAVLADQFGEPVMDGLAVLAAGVGVAGDGLGFQLGDQGPLAPLDVVDRLLQLFPAFGLVVAGVRRCRVAGELGGQQVVAMGAEDALGEEAAHDVQQDVFADPQAGRVSGKPSGPISVVALVGFAGIVGQVAAGLAEHAAVA